MIQRTLPATVAFLACVPHLLTSVTAAAPQEPESPAIWREVTGVKGIEVMHQGQPVRSAYFTRPHIPGFRTTADGRVGVIVEGEGIDGISIRFGLIAPEKSATPFLLVPKSPEPSFDHSYTMSWDSFAYESGNGSQAHQNQQFTNGSNRPSHVFLWDDDGPNAYDGDDVYDFTVLATVNTNNPRKTQIFATPVRVVVDSPKTAQANIASVTALGPPVAGPQLLGVRGFEPVVAGDGRLLVMRVAELPAAPTYTWTLPAEWSATGSALTGSDPFDICYAYYEEDDGSGGTTPTADPTGWTVMIPITVAHLDTRINTKFGFARSQMRDGAGNFITAGKDLGGSYPWIDRGAKNLFFEAVADRLRDGTSFRYPASMVPGAPYQVPDNMFEENPNYHQGVSVVGLWTHGKVVQLDNLLNDMDFAIGSGVDGETATAQTRLVDLFEANTDPTRFRTGEIELGFGRTTAFMPQGENGNGSIIDSVESKLAYRKSIRPIRLQDVVWHMTNGKQTDEVGFDDYHDPDALIIANMAGLLTWEEDVPPPSYAAQIHDSTMKHHSGWDGTDFNDPVRLQNAATAPAASWVVPKWGRVIGGGRLEPAAAGGVRGKGFWLDGANGLEFFVDNQPTPIGSRDWYVGLYVDCRFDDDGVRRRLLTFPDDSSLQLVGRRQVQFVNANGVVAHRSTLPSGQPDLLPRFGWAHLAVQVREAGWSVDLHLNGLLFDRWSDPLADLPLFQMVRGKFTLGKAAAATEPGVRGWTDDLKVFAHAVDAETAANHAGGTVIGLPAADTGRWSINHADRYPAWAHDELSAQLRNLGEIPSDKYAPLHDYARDHGVHEDVIAGSGGTHHRDGFHFPEGPLFWNAPRPDSTDNRFCTSCHHSGGLGGLNLGALTLDPTLPAFRDARRQPSQPPQTLHGVIPAGIVDVTNHSAPKPDNATTGPRPVDRYMFEAYANTAAVASLTLTDSTGKDLMELTPGAVVDPAILGTNQFGIRANLDVGQGSVTMTVDGVSQNIPATPPFLAVPVAATASPGTHTVRATGDNGVPLVVQFDVPAATWRDIAGYRDDYRAGAPSPGWSYYWNETGSVQSAGTLRPLAWTPAFNRYSGDGLTFPVAGDVASASLTATGGHPGRGTQQGANVDTFAVAAYEAQFAGEYRIVGGFVDLPNGSSNGLRLRVMTQSGATITAVQSELVRPGDGKAPALPSVQLAAGDMILVAIGPNGSDSFDTFSMDYTIQYR